MRRRGLPSGAFLGEMVVGHKKLKSYETPLLRANNENICVNRRYSVKRADVKTFCIIAFVNMLSSFPENGVF